MELHLMKKTLLQSVDVNIRNASLIHSLLLFTQQINPRVTAQMYLQLQLVILQKLLEMALACVNWILRQRKKRRTIKKRKLQLGRD